MIDIYKRYQVGLTLVDLYPERKDGLCSCGCNQELTGRKKRWATIDCQEIAVFNFLIIKGDTSMIRLKVFERDQGYCRCCGVFSKDWHADHILPVFLGGSACGLENIQTLCLFCHKEKTYKESHLETISSHAACIFVQRLEVDFGAISCEFPKQSIEIHKELSASSFEPATCS